MATRNLYIPENVSHPGTTLDEKMKEMGMSVKEFAVRTSKPEKTVIAIIKGDSSITPEMAVAFESVTKIPANFWMNRQRIYDECVARTKRQAQIASFAGWAKRFPYADMVNQGWVEKKTVQEEKTVVILDFFGVSSPTAWENYYMNQQLKVAFRISLATTKEPYAISAWLRKGELQASEINVGVEYSDKLLRSKLPAMKELMQKKSCKFPEQLQSLCAECGIKLIYTPCLKKAPISGSTRWINNIPCIQLSGRSKRYDTFWFSFFHEIGHILLHGKKDIFLEDIDYSEEQLEKERQADQFSSDVLLTEKETKLIIEGNDFGATALKRYAVQFNTHPAIIVGRLQHLGVLPFAKHVESFELFQ
jgi:addiction module HigA family antidote